MGVDIPVPGMTLRDEQHMNDDLNEKLGECSYYMWRERFPLNMNNEVEERRDIDNCMITLAFPREDRVTTGKRVGAGIYAFLPTEIVSGLIQEDFLLASSRESNLWDNKWNKGILDCIPSAFCAAFLSLMKSVRGAPPSARSYCFRYLPMDIPSHLVVGLCEMLKLGCMVGFDADVVNDMLQHKNLQVFKEDESFLLGFFRTEGKNPTIHQGSYSSSRGGRKSFEKSARPAKSQGWENRLQSFLQPIDKMKLDCTPGPLKMKMNLVKMLFPCEEQPEIASSSDLHFEGYLPQNAYCFTSFCLRYGSSVDLIFYY